MKTALILTINNDHWLIPGATPTDAGKLLGLLGGAVRVDHLYSHERSGQERWEVKLYPDHPEYAYPNAKVEMVPMSNVRMPKPAQDETTRVRKAKPVQGISGSPLLRLEGGKS